MPNKKYYIEYYSNGAITRERIRKWADMHRKIFPEYGFTNSQSDFPITHFIARRLKQKYDFIEIVYNDEVILKNTNDNFHKTTLTNSYEQN